MNSSILYAVLTPFFCVLVLGLLTLLPWLRNRNYHGYVALASSATTFVGALCTAFALHVNASVAIGGNAALSYHLGGWEPPIGIEFRVDWLNAFMLLLVSFSCLISTISSFSDIASETADRRLRWYSLALLFQTGISGMIATGDVFNVYVFLEVAALTGYALLSFSGGKAFVATLHYLLIGSVGACFYLLGVGYLYSKTGTLTMTSVLEALARAPEESVGAKAGALLCFLGLAIKLGMFPFHGWLPNAYTFASKHASSLVAPLATKTAMYVAIRLTLSVFPMGWAFLHSLSSLVVGLASIGILIGTLLALQQKCFKRMICYLMVAEAGYMMGGLWLGNAIGMTGATYHMLVDGLMTLCLFLILSIITSSTSTTTFVDLKGVFKDRPIVLAGFLVVAFSMVGIPPFPGFYSKFMLLIAGMQSSQWFFALALLASSLGNLILFLRVFEIGYFSEKRGLSAGTLPHYPLQALALSAATIALITLGILNYPMTNLIRTVVTPSQTTLYKAQ
jgi:multicomponent Na+:H+ antiporter subunit D